MHDLVTGISLRFVKQFEAIRPEWERECLLRDVRRVFLHQREREMALTDSLQGPISEAETVQQGTTLLVGKIAGLILDHLHKPDELKRLANELLQSQGNLAAAVAAGTAAEDEEPPESDE